VAFHFPPDETSPAFARQADGKPPIEGYWFLEDFGQLLRLRGTINGEKLKPQDETAADDTAGTFDGDLSFYGDHVSLTWTSRDGNRKRPVILIQVADETTVTITQGDDVTMTYTRPEFFPESPLAKAVEKELRADTARHLIEDVELNAKPPPQAGDEEYQDHIHAIDSMRIAYYSDSLISLRDRWWDLGGAHSNFGYDSRNFILRDGQIHKLELHELFLADSNYQSRLSDYCLMALRKVGASFVVSGEVKELSDQDMNAFVLGPKGITIMFSPFAVASNAEGAFHVTIPWKMISDIVVQNPLLDRWIARQKSHNDQSNNAPSVAQYDNNP
jgi:hypothetical protein